MTASQLLLLGGASAPAVDPYFYSVTSLLHGDGTNGAQNNTFLDSSTNNFTITRNGNTTQGSFSPFSQTGWSNFFDGTGDYLGCGSNAAYAMGTGDFTWEAWIYFPSAASYRQILSTRPSAGASTANGSLSVNPSNGLNWFTSTAIVDYTTSIGVNQWVHVAVSRSGTTLRVFANGIQVGSATNSDNLTGNTFTVGANGDGSETFNGYISNVRVVKGTAVYTSNFTPSTTPLSAISGTSLLTCQANRFRDASTNNFAITRNGDVSVQPFSPFNPITPYDISSVGGSGFYDGSGDWLTVPDNAALQMGSSNFTMEGWVYPTGSPGTINSMYGKRADASSFGNINIAYWNTGGIGLYVSSNTTGWDIFGDNGSIIAFRFNAWNHFALVRSGNNWAFFVNGVRTHSTVNSSSVSANSGVAMSIGAGAANGAQPIQGYLNGMRVVKGTAVYDPTLTTCTVPTAPLTAITNTSLLCNFTNAGIFDNAADADYETVGNAQISTSVKKYGTGSMAFDGTGDYLNAPSSTQFGFGTGDFTIEMWVYPTTNPANGPGTLFDLRSGVTATAMASRIDSSLNLLFYNGPANVELTVGSVALNTWTYIAYCRIAGTFKVFINGTQTYSATITSDFGSNQPLWVGANRTAGYNFYGYIDDLRISKGVARYPYNFTPPTAEFPNIGGTVTLTADPYYDYTTLLLPGNGTNGAQNNTFLDSSTNNFTITRNGNTTQGTFSPFSQTGWGNYFDGSGDYLSIASNAAFGFGTGDFTVEYWIYTPLTGDANQVVVDARASDTGIPWLIGNTTGGAVRYYDGTTVRTGGTISANQWTHIAWSRASNVNRVFVNGTQVSTYTATQDFGTTKPLTIGSNVILSAERFNGYVSNLRLIKGTALYTANFTPSTTPLTAISGTSLLTCQSNRFVDNSSNAFAITRNGDVSVQAFSPFNPTAAWSAATNGGSGYFDGSGDYLTAPNNAAFNFGTGDFTVEAWVYPTSTSGTRPIVEIRTSAANSTGFALLSQSGATTLNVYTNGGFAGASTASITTSAWNHVALVRSGNTWTYYINGASAGSFTNSSTQSDGATTGPKIGGSTTAGEVWVGYMGSVRILKGTAQYTGATYTIPTAPLTAITNTSLLLNYTNAGIYDATSKNDLETVGNAQISTTQSKFGGSSMLFDGTGDWLRTPTSPNLDMGTGDLTIEGWFYLTATVAVDYRMIVSDATNGNNYVAIRSGGTGGQLEVNVNGTSFRLNLNNSVTINTWFHLAVTRYNGTWYGFVNGASLGSNASAAAFNLGNGGMFVGRFGGATAYEWPGYIDDLRITKGIARYTSNFTPPTTAFLTL